MVTQDTAGDCDEDRQYIRDTYLRRLEIACSGFIRFSHPRDEALARLAETLAQGDTALTREILRRWGIRR